MSTNFLKLKFDKSKFFNDILFTYKGKRVSLIYFIFIKILKMKISSNFDGNEKQINFVANYATIIFQLFILYVRTIFYSDVI